MCAVLPDGETVPASGLLPDGVRAGAAGGRTFGVYLHVPFCATRCGYCDFNTYTADELKGGVSRATYADQAIAELRLARQVLGGDTGPAASVFVGGGTPTLLPAGDLVRMLAAVDELFGLAAGAEVTTEANPDSVDARSLATLREGGFTRLSLGMQSAVPAVLATLDRTHTPGRPAASCSR
jgi:oxygen-independent coproporphyrinogen-3 oxidase